MPVSRFPFLDLGFVHAFRTELVIDHHMFTNASAVGGLCAGQDPFSLPGVPALGALRQGDFKLIVGREAQVRQLRLPNNLKTPSSSPVLTDFSALPTTILL